LVAFRLTTAGFFGRRATLKDHSVYAQRAVQDNFPLRRFGKQQAECASNAKKTRLFESRVPLKAGRSNPAMLPRYPAEAGLLAMT